MKSILYLNILSVSIFLLVSCNGNGNAESIIEWKEKKKIDQTKKDIEKVMEMSEKNDFHRKPLKKGSYRWSDREKQE